MRNRFWAPPPAKADIATAILTNVIEHLVLLLPPNKHAFTAKAVWADFMKLLQSLHVKLELTKASESPHAGNYLDMSEMTAAAVIFASSPRLEQQSYSARGTITYYDPSGNHRSMSSILCPIDFIDI